MDDVPSAPARRGRPSTVARYVPSIVEWLRDQPELSSADILRRMRVAGYRGGKSALYELVRRVSTGAQQQLIVVACDREHLFNVFTRAFEGNTTVQLVLDRRIADRRQQSAPYEGERRQRNRRSTQTTDGQLRAMGWAIVRFQNPTKNRRLAGE